LKASLQNPHNSLHSAGRQPKDSTWLFDYDPINVNRFSPVLSPRKQLVDRTILNVLSHVEKKVSMLRLYLICWNFVDARVIMGAPFATFSHVRDVMAAAHNAKVVNHAMQIIDSSITTQQVRLWYAACPSCVIAPVPRWVLRSTLFGDS